MCASVGETCPIEPGTYTAAPFEPNFSFTIGDGWETVRGYADGGAILQVEAAAIYWASGVSLGRVGDEEVEIGPLVDDFVSFLHELSALGMTISDATPVTIDGAGGQQVDVETNDVAAAGVFEIDEERFNLVPYEKARFLVLNKDGETVLIIVDSFVASDFEEWLEIAQPVVESVRWEE